MSEIKEHIEKLLSQGIRSDGRKLLDYRAEITVERGVSKKSAEGSARVRIGRTEVVAGVKMEVGTPFDDSEDEGVLMVGVELLPLSNPAFESGPPSIESIELSRVIDRAIRESKCIDFNKLCIKAREKVWMVMVDIYPINDEGNLFDAAFLAAMAALQDAVFPKYDTEKGTVNYEEKTKQKLPLDKLPVECTVTKVGNVFLVDPSTDEWDALDARLTVGFLENGNICAMQKGGDEALTEEEIFKMIEIAGEKAKILRKVLQK
ncbi:MAG TPA: exosome complex protein Rrp42 [Candidatus Nanoarchaeia archaeon]|nr:exosome complex protein Rrp42 [Candidatus Nanoarchaeia archaeon]